VRALRARTLPPKRSCLIGERIPPSSSVLVLLLRLLLRLGGAIADANQDAGCLFVMGAGFGRVLRSRWMEMEIKLPDWRTNRPPNPRMNVEGFSETTAPKGRGIPHLYKSVDLARIDPR